MTERIVKTNDKEANQILNGEKTYFIRSDKDLYQIGYIIRFQNMRLAKPVYHQIQRIKYEVTQVDNWQTAPLKKGYQLISVRECND